MQLQNRATLSRDGGTAPGTALQNVSPPASVTTIPPVTHCSPAHVFTFLAARVQSLRDEVACFDSSVVVEYSRVALAK